MLPTHRFDGENDIVHVRASIIPKWTDDYFLGEKSPQELGKTLSELNSSSPPSTG
jgi:hypothetical protein